MTPAAIGAAEVLDAMADPGSFVAWAVAGAVRGSGADAVVIGEARVEGMRAALIVSDFDQRAGSIGSAAADRIVGAFRTATALGLPVVASPASGGTRIDEGTPAFVRMVDIAMAAADHRGSGLPSVVWLRHPTTGGTMATWGSLGQITLGQPGAVAGFLGPRLFRPLTGADMPMGVQTTDNLARVGVIDAVVDLRDLRETVRRVLSVCGCGGRGEGAVARESAGADRTTGAEAVAALSIGDILGILTDVTELSGTGAGERGDAVRVALGHAGGIGCVVVGQDRVAQERGDPVGPGALRTARRGISLAGELGLPLVSVVDTEGGELSPAAEEGALAREIGRCLADLVEAPVPTLSVLLGAGCGGAALALLPADRILATQGSWVAPLPLAGASLIKYRDTEHAAEIGVAMRVSAPDLAAAGIVDEVLGSDQAASAIGDAIAANLIDLLHMPSADRAAARADRYGSRLHAVPERQSTSR